MASFENIIREYLQSKAAEDAVFGEKYRAKCSKDKDVVAGCCAYIKSEAKKKAKGGCAVIEDAEVFGWAMHYIDEDIQEPKNAPQARTEVKTAEQFKEDALNPAKNAVSKPNPKPKAPKVDECQLSLF